MPAPASNFIVTYQAVGATDLVGLNAAINALMALNPNWQPWGGLAVTTGSGDTHHQAMVLYGPQNNIPAGGH
jgi:hypothetical protein